MTDLHMILVGVGILLLLGFLWIVKKRNDYYREFIAGVPLRFYREGGLREDVETDGVPAVID